jgi:hypothetical protein
MPVGHTLSSQSGSIWYEMGRMHSSSRSDSNGVTSNAHHAPFQLIQGSHKNFTRRGGDCRGQSEVSKSGEASAGEIHGVEKDMGEVQRGLDDGYLNTGGGFQGPTRCY